MWKSEQHLANFNTRVPTINIRLDQYFNILSLIFWHLIHWETKWPWHHYDAGSDQALELSCFSDQIWSWDLCHFPTTRYNTWVTLSHYGVTHSYNNVYQPSGRLLLLTNVIVYYRSPDRTCARTTNTIYWRRLFCVYKCVRDKHLNLHVFHWYPCRP